MIAREYNSSLRMDKWTQDIILGDKYLMESTAVAQAVSNSPFPPNLFSQVDHPPHFLLTHWPKPLTHSLHSLLETEWESYWDS